MQVTEVKPVSIEVQMPDPVFLALQQYLGQPQHRGISFDQAITTAVASWLEMDKVSQEMSDQLVSAQ